MPAPTETFWNIRRLNLLFMISAVMLLLSSVWFILDDYWRTWRSYQRQARVWQTAMTRDAMDQASRADTRQQLAQLQAHVQELRRNLPHARIEELQRQVSRVTDLKNKLTLRLAVRKGEIGPKEQEIERAKLAFGASSAQVRGLQQELAGIRAEYDNMAGEMAGYDQALAGAQKEIATLQAQVSETEKQISAIERSRQTLEEKLRKVNPTGAAWLGEQLRNAPLLDWMNPSEKIQQVVVPDILTDYNFVQVDTVDRCATCHVNIDNPAFEPAAQVAFVERQVAQAEGQNLNTIGNVKPVVMVDFWRQTVDRLPGEGARQALLKVDQKAMGRLNELLAAVGQPVVENIAQLPARLDEIARTFAGGEPISREQWYAQARYYLDDLHSLLQDRLGRDGYKQLQELYRRTLIARYNGIRRSQGLPAVDDDPVLLGHPRMDLFVEVESKHPMKVMGCTVCHEGAGQETDFTHATHTPRDIWVDAKTGAPVPASLIGARVGTMTEMERMIRRALRVKQSEGVTGATDLAVKPADAEGRLAHAEDAPSRYSHADLNLADSGDPAPFAPEYEPHGDAAAYHHPADNRGELRLAVRQASFWGKKHHWHEVHYMHWEKPMHALQYVESSCFKCHTEVYDIKDAAPTLFEGRKNFVALGCINCHSVNSVNDDWDVRPVGPSLVHVKDKLSAAMTASWIWSPKAFRPTTKMPHYFMLENNSAPADILRTRVEVAAITHYLRTTPPNPAAAPFQPQTPPGETGDPAKGKELLNSVGCLSCHANLAETGEAWIVGDLLSREGLQAAEAKRRFDAMDFNQRHWYALEHLSDRMTRVGPELSGVGTKLKAGRTEAEARQWLYGWLRDPQHYSPTTIMPSFRLSEQEANHVAAYLLTLERPGYEPEDFLQLDPTGQEMLVKLVATLKAGQVTFETAEREVRDTMSRQQQLEFLGKKMITHYGCNGCHTITGFENSPSACANLDEWGLKDPHKLDFGYFADGFDAQRAHPHGVYKVAHEGLESSAPQVGADSGKIRKVDLEWEHVPNSRRPWLYHKLHNTRIYDRGREMLNGGMKDGRIDIGRPYDKLKMPKFFMTDQEVQSLVTFVTAIRKPLVKPGLIAQTYSDAKLRQVRGRQLATMFNCYGCHNVEGNDVTIQQYYGTHKEDGSFWDNGLNWAPPRLVGQGSKTQPQWLHHFLQNVEPIRPWLQVRMPSFAWTPQQAQVAVDYFSGATEVMVGHLQDWLTPVDRWIAEHPGSEGADWFDQPALERQVNHLRATAIAADLATASALDPRVTTLENRRTAWNKALGGLRTLVAAFNHLEYPYIDQFKPQISDEDMARGERLFATMGCMAGECHRMGDEAILGAAGLLVRPADAAAAEDDAYGGEGSDDGYGAEGAKPAEGAVPAGLMVTPKNPPAGAPNLTVVAERLQHQWVRKWLRHALTMQPGTRMQQFWPEGESFFKPFPPDARAEKEAIFGSTADQQEDILLNFLYAAGRKRITYNIDGTRLGGEPTKEVTLGALSAPAAGAAAGTPATTATPEAPRPQPKAAEPAKPATDDKAAEAYEPTHSSIELPTTPVSAAQGTRLVGVVKLDGNASPRRPIRMTADPVCDRFHRQIGHTPRVESLVVSEAGELRDVFIYVKEGLPAAARTVPATPAVIDQIGCMYVPHVRGVVAGQPLKILNSDPTLHNVKMTSANNGSFNEGMPVKGMELDRTLSRPELSVHLKCDVHPWMLGVVYVVDNPYFAVSDVQGRYEIKGLPPGKYVLEAVHEDRRIEPVQFEVEVKADAAVRQDVVMKR